MKLNQNELFYREILPTNFSFIEVDYRIMSMIKKDKEVNVILNDNKKGYIEIFDYKSRIAWRIYRSEDEWYYIKYINKNSSEIKYYLCDQYEGLIKLLKNKELINYEKY